MLKTNRFLNNIEHQVHTWNQISNQCRGRITAKIKRILVLNVNVVLYCYVFITLFLSRSKLSGFDVSVAIIPH